MARKQITSDAFADLDVGTALALERYCAAVVAGKLTDQMQELDREALLGFVLPVFLQDWLDSGSQPPNPLLATGQAQCRFQLKRGLKVVLPEGCRTVAEALATVGLPPFRRRLFTRFVRRTEATRLLTSFEALAQHKNKRIAKAAKLLWLLLEEHDADALSGDTILELKDEQHFLNTLPKLASNATEMLRLLRVFVPTLAFSDVVHGDALTAVEARNKSLRIYESDDHQIKCIVDRRDAHLYERRKGSWQKLGVRGYPRIADARQFAERMTTDPKAFRAAAKSLSSAKSKK